MITRQKILFLLALIVFSSCTQTTKKVISTPKVKQPTKPASLKMIHSTIADQTAVLGSSWKTYYIIPNPSKLKIISQSFNGSRVSYIDHQENGLSVIRTRSRKATPIPDTLTIQTKTSKAEANLSFTLNIVKNKGTIKYVGNLKQLQVAINNHKKNHHPITIFLNSGSYRNFTIKNQSNITLVPAMGQKPTLQGITIENSSNIQILSLDIQAEKKEGKKDFYVKIDKASSNITVANCKIQAAEETEPWEPKDWQSKAGNGIFSEGDNCIFKNNLIRHIHHGIETKGNNCIVANNIIIRFAGDAIRNTGNNNIFDSNYLADALVDDYSAKGGNHDDLFQSWTFDKPISNLIIKNNIAISCTDTLNHLLSKNVQGIACFDGFEENWIIENNLVILEHPHGIALFGANNCKIKNNKIIYNPFQKYQFESLPWIMIHDHKDGRKSHNNLITNNITSAIAVKDKESATITNNTITSKPFSKYFQDYQNWIFDKK